MGHLSGRVAVITGAGRGIGREHALLYAAEGAHVVVNDLGGSSTGEGADASAAQQVADEITARGGSAIANHDDVATWDGAQLLVQSAIDHFGQLDVLVNNAGILRDRMLVNMSEQEWDSVLRVHLKGHFGPLRHAADYWRAQVKAGHKIQASVINTSSTSGLFGQPGQANYGAAKMGIAALTIIAAMELTRYGVRVNAIAPAARTRLTEEVSARMAEPNVDTFDEMDPANVSPFVGYLGTEDCRITGQTFLVYGGEIQLFKPFSIADGLSKDGRWTLDELTVAAQKFADVTFDLGNPFARSSN